LNINDLLNVSLLKDHIFKGVVSEIKHPDYPNLKIYNYTHVAQHDNIWDSVTEQCRGLIVDSGTGDVLARPFRKFFNLNTSFRPETHEVNLPSWQPKVLEKLDGSLGILYHYAGKPYIATRGSFASDQANWATKWYNEHYHPSDSGLYTDPDWPEGYTPLFEIIYKENRIVVSYEYEGLVLLGLVNIKTGFELSSEETSTWGNRNGLRVATEYQEFTLEKCKSFAESNREGFVLQYWNSKAPIPLRIKIKTEEYVRLHKVITGLNPKGIWEHLMSGYDPEALWRPAIHNKQFVEWCTGWITTFQRMYDKTESEAISAFGRVAIFSTSQLTRTTPKPDERATRKVWAMAIQQEPANLHPILFACLSGGDWKVQIWKQFEPKILGKEVYIRNADEFNGL
jgi:RNA ligase